MRPLFLIAIIALSFSACKQKSSQEGTKQAAGALPQVWPTLPIENLRILVAECDYIDLIMYNPQFSMSVNKRNDVVSSIQQISEAAVAHDPSGPQQPLGRMFFNAKGETLLEADLYLSPQSGYFVFYQDGKQAYANAMTEQGAAFYNQVLNQVRQGMPQ